MLWRLGALALGGSLTLWRFLALVLRLKASKLQSLVGASRLKASKLQSLFRASRLKASKAQSCKDAWMLWRFGVLALSSLTLWRFLALVPRLKAAKPRWRFTLQSLKAAKPLSRFSVTLKGLNQIVRFGSMVCLLAGPAFYLRQ